MTSACTAFSSFVGVCLTALSIGAAEPAAPATPVVPLVPTVIESAGPGEMVSTATETTFSFRDQVVVTGTNLRLSCDQLVVIAKRTGDPKATIGKQENFKSLIATGRVRLLQNDREATCDRAEVLPGDDKVTLEGNVTVRSLDNRFVQTGPKATLYRGQMRAVFEQPRFVLPALNPLGPKDGAKPKSPAGSTPAPADATTAPIITVPIAPTPAPPK
jgi:lipopolysaccharide export system protein LptA